MITIGIDPGLVNTGYVVLDTKNAKILFTGQIFTSNKNPLSHRLAVIYDSLCDVMETYKNQKIVVIIEKMFINNNSKTSMDFAAVRGILLLMIAQYTNLRLFEPLSTSIRKLVTGHGKRDKQYVKNYIFNLYPNLSGYSEHVCDAALCALYGSLILK